MLEPFLLFVKDRRSPLPAVVVLEDTDPEGARLAATAYLERSHFVDWVTIVDFAQRMVSIMRDQGSPICAT